MRELNPELSPLVIPAQARIHDKQATVRSVSAVPNRNGCKRGRMLA